MIHFKCVLENEYLYSPTKTFYVEKSRTIYPNLFDFKI